MLSSHSYFLPKYDYRLVYSYIMISPVVQQSRISVPNALSASRIIGVPFLFILVGLEDVGYFVFLYTLLAFTDWLDGFLARRWNQVSEFGSMLDSIGDIALYLSTVYFFIALFPENITPSLPYVGIFAVLFIGNIITSKIRTGRVLFIHSHLSRFGAVFLVGVFLSSFYIDTTFLLKLVVLNYCLAMIEAILMFAIYKDVDPDTRSIFRLMRKD